MNPLAAALKKAIGSNDTIQEVAHWLDTGFPPLNKAISGSYDGGIPAGRIIEIFGPSSSGKTLIATKAMIAAQKVGGIAAFMDHENSFDVGLAIKYGLDADEENGQWVFKTPETFEESMDLTFKVLKAVRDNELIPADAPIVFVYDSLASMVPKSKAEKLDKGDDIGMNDNTALARATAAHFPTLAMWCRKYNATAIFLNQIRTKLGVMYGDTTTSPGGNAPEFYASVRIKLGREQIKEGTVKVGQRIGAECIKNKVSEPFQKVKWDYYFDTDIGLDVIGSTVDHLIEEGVFTPASRKGYFEVNGKQVSRKQLTEFFRDKGEEELFKLLPKS